MESVVIQNFSTIGAGCVAQPPAKWRFEQESQEQESPRKYFSFPSRTVIFGQESKFRLWSGNGVRQADALHVKHLDYLRESKSARAA